MHTESLSQQEEKCAWPICPSFLVKSVVKNEKYLINKHGVYAPDAVRGLLADASDDIDIQNPLSLFQVVSETIEFEEFPYTGRIRPAEDDFFLRDILKGKQVLRVDTNSLYKTDLAVMRSEHVTVAKTNAMNKTVEYPYSIIKI